MAMGDHSSAGSAVGCDALHRPSHHLLTRKERSRDLAQKRRLSFKHLMDELAEHLPLAKDVVDQMDHNSCLRVALSFVRMKTFMMAKGAVAKETKRNAAGGAMRPQGAGGCGMRGVQKECPSEVAQELMTEALDGFMMITLFDGEIVYISENVHSHLKLFHSECIGGSLYDLVSEDDHEELKTNLAKIEAETLYKRSEGSTTTSFFCRMKCSRFKVSNYAAKPSGYKLMLISGRPSTAGSEHFFVAMVAPVAPPAILEVRSGYNVFVTHYALDMKCTFFDGRLQQLHGYSKGDLIGHVPFEFHHHDDIKITLQCSQGLMTKGEGLSGYYRYLTRHGNFIWMQSHATMIHDNRTGDPSYIVCVNFIINDDVEQPEQLTLNQATSGTSELSFVQHPFPILLGDGEMMNPLDADSSETVGGDIAPTKSRGSPADETSSSSGMVFPAGSSPTASCTLNTSPSSSVPLPDSGVDDVSPEFIFVGVSPVQPSPSHPPPPPSLSPLSDYGYSSPSFQVNLPTWVPSPAPPPSLSPFSNGSPTTSEHSTNQRPMTLDTPMLSPHPSSILPPITATQQSPDHHHLNPSPSLPHHSPMPSPQCRASSSSSPSEAIGSYANYGHTGNTQDSLRRHSTSLFIQDRMDSRQYAPTSPGGLCDEDGETGRSMWGCHEMEEEGTLLPMLTQDDLNMLDLLGPMNTWA